MKTNELVFSLLKELKEKNINAYLIGGSSRDYLLNKEFIDIDICSSSLPSVNKEAMKEYELVSNDGLYYGVLKYVIDSKEVEITSLRKEGPYIKNRRPSTVEFIDDLYIDSLRRDFTINAIYIDSEGNVKDFHNGLEDLKNKVIRMIGDPIVRINEDALRILRAIRLSKKINFDLDDNLKKVILNQIDLVYSLNKNTLRKEINKFLEDNSLSEVNELLRSYGLEMERLYEY